MTAIQKAKLWHKLTGSEYFVLSNGAIVPWHWLESNSLKIYDIVDSSGDGSSIENLLTKIEKKQ